MITHHSKSEARFGIRGAPRRMTRSDRIMLATIAVLVFVIVALFAALHDGMTSAAPPNAFRADAPQSNTASPSTQKQWPAWRERATSYHRDGEGCLWANMTGADGWRISAKVLIDGRPLCDATRRNDPPAPPLRESTGRETPAALSSNPYPLEPNEL